MLVSVCTGCPRCCSQAGLLQCCTGNRLCITSCTSPNTHKPRALTRGKWLLEQSQRPICWGLRGMEVCRWEACLSQSCASSVGAELDLPRLQCAASPLIKTSPFFFFFNVKKSKGSHTHWAVYGEFVQPEIAKVCLLQQQEDQARCPQFGFVMPPSRCSAGGCEHLSISEHHWCFNTT